MAKHLDAKASLATGEKKARLSGLAAVGRLLAEKAIEQERLSLEEPELDADKYRQAVPYLNAAVAHLPPGCTDPRTIVKAIVGHLASMGLDEEEILHCKPYVKRFTKDMINRQTPSRREVLGRDSQQATGSPLQNIAEVLEVPDKDIDLAEEVLAIPAKMLKNPPILGSYPCPSQHQSRRVETLWIAEALLRPSFDAETLLRVIAEPNCTIVELSSAASLFEHPFTCREIVAPDEAARFWAELNAIMAGPFDINGRMGLDGITIKVDCRTPAGQKRFQVWSPEPTSHTGMLIGLIYDLAEEASNAPAAIQCLERLRSHLRNGT
ncbi:hypothetical protein [Bradyrhizobium sp. B117]|uniref:hypothetical protein n=1 Tax=Bradyrhizobium sp. B117 TaxID=3140246 RepID=UPI003184421C